MKTRISLWDNARFILMALVVVGHMITTTRMDSTLAYAIYAYLYLFHMPAMILVSGYFSKVELNRNAVRATLGLLATWVTFEIIWIFYRWVIDGNAFSNTFLIVPSWTLWFLVTLITMRILLPFIAALKHPLIVSLIIALVAGLSPDIGTEFSVMRTMSFLPFFVFGWLAREHGWLAGHRFLNPSVALKAGAARGTRFGLAGSRGWRGRLGLRHARPSQGHPQRRHQRRTRHPGDGASTVAPTHPIDPRPFRNAQRRLA